MQFQEIYACTKKAFEKGEVRELLEGKNNYNYQAPMYPVSLPTCIEFVLRDGIYPLYKETLDSKIVEQYHEALKNMIVSEDVVTVWWATSILFSQKNREKEGKSPFSVADDLWPMLRTRLPMLEESLLNNFKYLGGNFYAGLWGDVLRINDLLRTDHGICLLED